MPTTIESAKFPKKLACQLNAHEGPFMSYACNVVVGGARLQ